MISLSAFEFKNLFDMQKNLSRFEYVRKESINFCNMIGYQYIIEPFQRIIRSSLSLPSAMKSWELYVAHIPKRVREVELFKLFSTVGHVYEMRLMYNIDNYHRSFCYVKYFTMCDLKNALKLNCYQIRPNYYLRVNVSINNCSLYFGKLPKDLQLNQFVSVLKQFVDGIVHVDMPSDLKNKYFNRQYAFVKFDTHKKAFKAKTCLKGFLEFYGIKTVVDWADRIDHVDPEVMNKVRVMK